MERLIIRPAREGQSLTIEGTRERFSGPRSVPSTEYYRRMVAKGDAALVEPEAAPPAKKGA
jgi:hypothetical protein